MRKFAGAAICVAVVSVVVAGCGAGTSSTSTATGGQKEAKTSKPVANKPKKAGSSASAEAISGSTPTSSSIPDGHWQRGVDFKPGTYRAPGGEECEWAQAEKLEAVEVGSGHTNYGVNLLVEITDRYFRTEGCGVWKRQGSASSSSEEESSTTEAESSEGNGGTTTISDGHWQRGTDYKSGLYRAPGGQECEWAQANSPNGIETGSGHTNYGVNLLAEIEDAYFRTEGCGTWHLAEGGPEGSNVPTATTIPDGHWRSGTDFQPGTYRAPGGAECEWAESSTANGVETGNGNTHYGKNVLAEFTEEFIRTEGCGTWKKSG